MDFKFIEIRDEGTCIAALAIRTTDHSPIERVFLEREGYPPDGVILIALSKPVAANDPYDWPSCGFGRRTMPPVHLHLINHWDDIDNGSVIDTRVCLGETVHPARPEIMREADPDRVAHRAAADAGYTDLPGYVEKHGSETK